MSQIIKPVALDETLQSTNAKLDALKQDIGGQSEAIEGIASSVSALATDSTLQTTNSKLGTLDTDLKNVAKDSTLGTLAKDSTLGSTNTALGNLAKDSTLQTTNSKLGDLATDSTLQEIRDKIGTLDPSAAIEALTNGLIGVLSSVKSINGKYGVVVLDSGDILINRTAAGSKTVKEMITELQTAVSKTPLTFAASKIAETENDYLLTITQGTPA